MRLRTRLINICIRHKCTDAQNGIRVYKKSQWKRVRLKNVRNSESDRESLTSKNCQSVQPTGQSLQMASNSLFSWITMSSAVTKRKYVFQELNDMSLPTNSQSIVRIVQARGQNLHEVVTPTGEQYIVSMPTKFRQNIWVKRGDYIVVEPIVEGKKVKGEIVKILTKDHIKWYRAQNCWPPEFDEDPKRNGDSIATNYTTCDDEELFVNTNRCPANQKISDSDSSESDSH